MHSMGEGDDFAGGVCPPPSSHPGRPLAEFLAQAITVDHPFLFFPVTFCVGEGAAEGRGGVGDVTRAANRTGYRLVEEKATECVGGGKGGRQGHVHVSLHVRGAWLFNFSFASNLEAPLKQLVSWLCSLSPLMTAWW